MNENTVQHTSNHASQNNSHTQSSSNTVTPAHQGIANFPSGINDVGGSGAGQFQPGNAHQPNSANQGGFSNVGTVPSAASMAQPAYAAHTAPSYGNVQHSTGLGGAPVLAAPGTGPATGVPASGTVPGVNPGSDVSGTHPNPTHISNQFRPGTTFNTAPVAKDGAQLHGGPPPPIKEGPNTSINLPENHRRTS